MLDVYIDIAALPRDSDGNAVVAYSVIPLAEECPHSVLGRLTANTTLTGRCRFCLLPLLLCSDVRFLADVPFNDHEEEAS